jgi:hypothetical protein
MSLPFLGALSATDVIYTQQATQSNPLPAYWSSIVKPFFNEECQRLKGNGGEQVGIMSINLKTYGYWNANISCMYVLKNVLGCWPSCKTGNRLNMFHVNSHRFGQLFRGSPVDLEAGDPTTVRWCMGHIF